ncbi:MAG TPA: gamma-aminobutyraldehyde dehydrogenase [Candidatus Nanopelagicaceae bacterium]|nr:gamma-aminobutyraldehyde dehydrogenase [Candidatus Nanopelagicaceae bacterium]
MQWIDGKPAIGGGGELSVINPANGQSVETFRAADSVLVNNAVGAAKKAFPEWSSASPVVRSNALHNLAQILEDRSAEFARVESEQTGKPIRLSTGFDLPGTIDNIRYFAGVSRDSSAQAQNEYSPDHTSSLRREAAGVVGSIAPWNYPLQMAGWKILPAVAAGCTIVLKPSELTPITSVMFAQAATEAGFPDGVINVVTGSGREAGEALVSHPDVDMVSFTGSTSTGRRVMQIAAQSAKRIHLELGGKAPFLVFDDSDLEAAIHGAVAASLINGGQDCTAATRAYVQRPLYEDFIAGVTALFEGIQLGDPMDLATDLGPLISSQHRDRVHGFVERALTHGAKVHTGGRAPSGSLSSGAYYQPTLITGARQDSEIVQDEIFGPVLVALPFDSDEEGLALAADTPYGLAASVWTRDIYRAGIVTRSLRAGTVWVNDHIPIVSEMPHGGFGASGFGKDMSAYSLQEYTVLKHVMNENTGKARKDWHRTIFAIENRATTKGN